MMTQSEAPLSLTLFPFFLVSHYSLLCWLAMHILRFMSALSPFPSLLCLFCSIGTRARGFLFSFLSLSFYAGKKEHAANMIS